MCSDSQLLALGWNIRPMAFDIIFWPPRETEHTCMYLCVHAGAHTRGGGDRGTKRELKYKI